MVVVVALGLAAAGIWITAMSRPSGDAAASVVEHTWAGLDRIAMPPDGVDAHTPGPFRRALRSAARAVRAGSDVAAIGVASLGLGVGDGVRATIAAVAADPVGSLVGGGGAVAAVARDPLGVTRAQLHAAVAYARALRELPPREAYRRFMRDLGEVGVDLALTRGKQLAIRSLLRAVRARSRTPSR